MFSVDFCPQPYPTGSKSSPPLHRWLVRNPCTKNVWPALFFDLIFVALLINICTIVWSPGWVYCRGAQDRGVGLLLLTAQIENTDFSHHYHFTGKIISDANIISWAFVKCSLNFRSKIISRLKSFLLRSATQGGGFHALCSPFLKQTRNIWSKFEKTNSEFENKIKFRIFQICIFPDVLR